jgi:hypothetical protein
LLNIEKNPTQNTTNLWNQVGGTGAEFLPDLSYAPSSWAIALIPDTTVVVPMPQDFGSSVTVGSQPSDPFVIFNSGSNPLYVTGVKITGAVNGNFTETNNCLSTTSQVSESQYQSCNITVTFAPTLPGYQSATVVITSNSTTSPDTVMVSGTAVVGP